MRCSEKLLQQAWYQRLYEDLVFFNTEEYEHPIEILSPGTPNDNAGPDFFNAKVRIGSIVWVGNVEIHHRASEWYKHGHHNDPLYDNTILHVVLENDHPVRSRLTGLPIFSCIMNVSEKRMKALVHKNKQNPTSLPCSGQLARIPLHLQEEWKEMLFKQRLQAKADRIEEIYASTRQDISETLHILIMRYWGTKVNNDAFEAIARSLPMRVIRKHTDRQDQLEALYLGQGGLLEGVPQDEYQAHLQQEYTFLRAKYDLTPIAAHRLRLLRLRPNVFPHRRLALMAALRHRHPLLESLFAELTDAQRARQVLAVTPSAYWQKNYRFNTPSPHLLGSASSSSSDIMFINVVLPYQLFLIRQQQLCCTWDGVKAWSRKIRPEDNTITRMFSQEGLQIKDALDGQAVIELWDKYCSTQGCSLCVWGEYLKACPQAIR